MAETVELVIRAEDKSSGTIKNIRRSITGLDKDAQGAASRGLGKLKTALGAGLKTAVATGTAAIAGMGAVIGKATKDAADMEQQVANIRATMGLTADQTGELNKLITDLGLDPNLKVTAVEAGQAIEMLGKNGLTMTEIMDGAARSTVLLANATGADLGGAADIATDVMAQFNIDAENMMSAINGIVGVTKSSKFSIDDYRLAIGQAGGVAGSMGVEFGEMNAVLAAISPNFSGGSDAGTSFKNFLQRLVPQTEKAKEVMGDLGLFTAESGNAFFDASGNMKSMEEIAGILQGAFAGLTEEQRNSAAATLFGTDANRVAFGLADAGSDTIAELKKTIGNTDAEEAAATRMDTFKGALEIASGVVETMSIQIGQKFLPVLRPLIERFTALSETHGPQVVAFFGEMADSLRRSIEWVISWVEAGAPLKTLLELLPEPIQNVIAAVGGFTEKVQSAIQPITDIISQNMEWKDMLGGVAALIGAIIIPAIASFLTAMAPVIAIFAAGVVAVQTMRTAWEENWFGIRDHIAGIIARVREIITLGMELFKKHWGEGTGALRTIAEEVWKEIGIVVETAMNVVKNVLDVVIGLIQGDWETAWKEVKDIFQGVWDGIKELISARLEFIRGLFDGPQANGILNWFKENFPNAADALQKAVERVTQLVKDLIPEIGRTVESVMQTVQLWLGKAKLFWETHGDQIKSVVDKVITKAIETIADILEATIGVIKSVLKAFQGDWKGAWEELREAGELIWNRIKDNVTAILGAMRSIYETWLERYVDKGLERFRNLRDGIVERVTNIKETVIERWRSIRTRVTETVRGLVEGVMSRMRNWLSWIKERLKETWDWIKTNLNPLTWIQIGVDWVQGLWDGFKRRWNNFTDWLDRTWDGLIRNVKNAFGISSPSTVFRDIGTNIVGGLTLGINDNISSAVNAADRLGAAVIESVKKTGMATKKLGKGWFEFGDPSAGTGGGGSNGNGGKTASEGRAASSIHFMNAFEDFLSDTVSGVSESFDELHDKHGRFLSGEEDELRSNLRDTSAEIHKTLRDILLDVGGKRSNTLEGMLEGFTGLTATQRQQIPNAVMEKLAQQLFNFRDMAGGGGLSVFDDALPTSAALVGADPTVAGDTNYNFEINLTSSEDDRGDIIDTIELLTSLTQPA